MVDLFKSVQAHCLGKPGAYEDYPWGETVWKVAPKGKVFCFGSPPPLTAVTVRATLEEQAALTNLPGIDPAPYLARHGWVRVDLSEPQNRDLALDLIDRSYELVVGKSRGKKLQG